MEQRGSGLKQLITVMAIVVGALICAVPLLAYKANPYGGSRRGSDWQLTVVDPRPDSANTHELVTGLGFNFSQMTSNSTISVWFDTVNIEYAADVAPTDTARIHITGIGTDSAYVDTSFKVAAGDTVATARTFYMWEAAYLDTAVGGAMRIWTTTGSVSSTLLDSIPRGQLDLPMAHRLFGKQHSPTIKSVVLQHQAAADTLHYEVRYYPNLPNYRRVASRQEAGPAQFQVLVPALLNQGNPQAVFLLDKVLDPYSAIAIFSRESAAPNGVTAAVMFNGEYR